MPVVSRPPKGPSGLEKFLQTLNVTASVGGRVADFIQGRKQLALTERQTDLAETEEARLSGQRDDDVWAKRLDMGINALAQARTANFAGMAARGEQIDPSLYTAAGIISDIPDPVLREETREAVAYFLGRDPSEIDDRFILSPTNLQSEASRDVLGALTRVRGLRALQGQASLDPNAASAAAEVGEAGVLSGITGVSPRALTRREAGEAALNEMLRVGRDPETGELTLSGTAYNNPTTTMMNLLTSLGHPLPLTEFDPSAFGMRGPNRMIPGAQFDEFYRLGLERLWTSDENDREITRQMAQTWVEAYGIPYEEAIKAVQGDLSNMTTGNARFIEQMRTHHRALVSFMGQLSPVNQQIMTLGNLMSNPEDGWGLPAEQVIPAMQAMLDYLRESNPSLPVFRNYGAVQRSINALVGDNSTFDIVPGQPDTTTSTTPGGVTIDTPPRAGTIPGTTMRTPGNAQISFTPLGPGGQGGTLPPPQRPPTNVDRATDMAFGAAVEVLRAMPRAERSAWASAALGTGYVEFTDAEGNPHIIRMTDDLVQRIMQAAEEPNQ